MGITELCEIIDPELMIENFSDQIDGFRKHLEAYLSGEIDDRENMMNHLEWMQASIENEKRFFGYKKSADNNVDCIEDYKKHILQSMSDFRTHPGVKMVSFEQLQRSHLSDSCQEIKDFGFDPEKHSIFVSDSFTFFHVFQNLLVVVTDKYLPPDFTLNEDSIKYIIKYERR